MVEGLDMAIEQRMKVRPVIKSIISSMAIRVGRWARTTP
jgi:hypothetical protein